MTWIKTKAIPLRVLEARVFRSIKADGCFIYNQPRQKGTEAEHAAYIPCNANVRPPARTLYKNY